jgi:DNA-binding transcriptional ArsR family regulator
MAFSKAHQFTPDIYAFSLLCKALAHPARIQIIKRILDNNNHMTQVADLAWGLPISAAALTQHLKILRYMHILYCEEQPPLVFYQLNEQTPGILNGICKLIFLLENNTFTDYSEIELLGRRRRSGTSPL